MYSISVPNFTNRVFICVCYFGPRVFRTSHTCMYQLLLSSPSSIIALFFAIIVCLLLRQACLKNELITWMYCWLVFCCHFFQFFTLATACLFAFVTPAGVFLERAIYAFIRFQLFQPRSYVYVYYFGMRVFRTNHTFIYPFPTQFSHRVARLYALTVSARVLERAIHAFFRSVPNFSNCDFIQLRLLFRLAC